MATATTATTTTPVVTTCGGCGKAITGAHRWERTAYTVRARDGWEKLVCGLCLFGMKDTCLTIIATTQTGGVEMDTSDQDWWNYENMGGGLMDSRQGW